MWNRIVSKDIVCVSMVRVRWMDNERLLTWVVFRLSLVGFERPVWRDCGGTVADWAIRRARSA